MVPVLVMLASVGQAGWSPPPTASCKLANQWSLLAAWEVDPLRPTVVVHNFEGVWLWSPLDGSVEPLWEGPGVTDITSSDVSGDGQLDLVIRTWEEDNGYAVGALVDRGDVSGVALLPSGPDEWHSFTGLGDVDGNGAGDLAAGQELWVSTSNAPWLALQGVVGQDTYDQGVFRLGDVDGDGIDDLAVTAWSPGYPYQQPYGPLDVLLGDEVFPTLGGTIGSTEGSGFGVVDVNVDADAAREFLLVRGSVADDYGGIDGGLTLVDDLASGLVELASHEFATYDFPSGVGGAFYSHKLLLLRDGSSVEPAVVAWINDQRIEELELTGPGLAPAEIRSVAVYTPPDAWRVVDGLATDLDHDGAIDLVAAGEATFGAFDSELVAWLRSTDGGTLPATAGVIACDEPDLQPDPDPVEPQPTSDPRSCGCSSSHPAGGGAAILLWLVAIRRRRC